MGDYDHVTNDMFDAELARIVGKMTAAEILAVPGAYETLSEELNNAVLDALNVDPSESWPEDLDVISLDALTPDALDYGDDAMTAHVRHGRNLFRVSWRIDHDAEPPEWDANTPYVYLSDRYAGKEEHDDAVTIRRAWLNAGSEEIFARYLRIFYGATSVAVTGDTGDSPAMAFFDTPEWRRMTGYDPAAPLPEGVSADDADPARQTREVWRAYYDGKVYGFTVETWQSDDWQEIESCWGFYGDSELEYVISEHVRPSIKHNPCWGACGVAGCTRCRPLFDAENSIIPGTE